MKPGALGSINAVGVGSCRASETISVPGTTTISADKDEIAVLVSTESNAVIAAFGQTPDASANAETEETSAGFAVAPLMMTAIAVAPGDKIDIKAFA